MRIKVLGSAAGGGFPQWNCACSNCSRFHLGKFAGRSRSQAELAWGDNGQWTLLNASPDLRAQIEANPELWPQKGNGHGTRNSPISDVILTGAEVDQVIGLLLLREFHAFRIHSTPSVRDILTRDNSLFGVLDRFTGQTVWTDIPLDRQFLVGSARLEPLPLSGSFPGFVGASRLQASSAAEAVIGLCVSPQSGGSTLAFLPSVPALTDDLLARLRKCDVLLIDGTFWSDDEPSRIPGVDRTARQMGHVPISGTGGSLERLAELPLRKVFIHINNTNPILDEESPEHRMVRDNGWEVAHDGMEIVL
jgi:pyrroloquinoline quinone biosynthesis protein B